MVSGATKIDNVAAPCRVFLHNADGTLRGYRRTGADGSYTFIGLPPGEYRLVIEDDRQGSRRSKVEHVVVTAPPATTRVFWRVFITSNNGGSYKGVTEVEFLGAADTLLTNPAAANIRALASSNVNVSNTPAMAFDGSTTNGWLSYDNSQDEYIGWQFDEPGGSDVDVLKVALRGSWNHPDGSPMDFQIQSSVDGGTWVTEMTVAGQTGWTGASDRRVFTLP